MKNYLQAFSYLVATSVALTWGSIAHAISISTAGTWTSGTIIEFDAENDGVSIDAGTPTGLGTDRLSWGEPFSDQGSSFYQFDGLVNLNLDDTALSSGTSFQIGAFNHHNAPILPPLLTAANLALTLDIEGQGSHTLDLAFNHEETPNVPNTCAFAGDTICPDRVSLPTAGTPERFTLGSISYEFQLLGFSQVPDGPFSTDFITQENQDNTTFLFGQLRQLPSGPFSSGGPPPVPEPGTLLASGLLLGLGSVAKARSQASRTQ